MIGKKPAEHQMSIFDVALESFIDMNHELVLLSKQIARLTGYEPVEALTDRGYRGKKRVGNMAISIPSSGLPGELLPETESSEEVLQACGNRAGYRPPEIRPPDDAELPQGNPWGRHQYDDGCRSVQHEALDEQTCLVFFCLLAADAGQTPGECVI